MIATLQQQSCKLPDFSDYANSLWMDVDGFAADSALIKALCKFARMAPSKLAKEAGLTPTTILRPFNGTAETRLSQPTFDKLKRRFANFPNWRNEQPDQIGHHNYERAADPNERPDELVFIREVDISLAMGDGAVVEDYPATQLVPFNLGFIRSVSTATTEKLLIVSGHGESMEPTLLRSDILMIDTANLRPAISDQIWAFHYAGGGMIKRLRHAREAGRDCFIILSDNSAVPPQVAEVDDIHIIGKLVWVGRRM